MKLHHILLSAAALSCLMAGCAREADSDVAETIQRRVSSWLHVNYPDAVPSGNGIYILEETPGTGDLWDPENSLVAYVIETRRQPSGEVSSTGDEELARQIGSWTRTGYYGPTYWYAVEGSCYEGILESLDGMRVGGYRKVLIPSWLLTYKSYSSPKGYLDHASSDASDMILEFTLEGQGANLIDRQIVQLTDFSARYMNGVDSTYYNGVDSTRFGFYFHRLRENTLEGAEMPSDTTVYINYVGRRMDGVVFDTNVADSAKVYGIYSTSKTYGPIPIYWGDKYSDITMTTSKSTPVTGFQMALWHMRPDEKAITAFYSALGYGSSGSGSAIPSYQPISFTIELVEEP